MATPSGRNYTMSRNQFRALAINRWEIIRWFSFSLLILAFWAVTAQAQQQRRTTHTPPPTGTLTLEACIDIALQRNSSVLIAERRAKSAEAVAFSSWSNVMPRFSTSLMNSTRSVQGDQVFIGPQPREAVIARPFRRCHTFEALVITVARSDANNDALKTGFVCLPNAVSI